MCYSVFGLFFICYGFTLVWFLVSHTFSVFCITFLLFTRLISIPYTIHLHVGYRHFVLSRPHTVTFIRAHSHILILSLHVLGHIQLSRKFWIHTSSSITLHHTAHMSNYVYIHAFSLIHPPTTLSFTYIFLHTYILGISLSLGIGS